MEVDELVVVISDFAANFVGEPVENSLRQYLELVQDLRTEESGIYKRKR